jgi:hypothetical protein
MRGPREAEKGTPSLARRDTRPERNGQRPSTSEEYGRFESLVKRIVRIPKKEIDAQRKREGVRKRS